MCIRVNHLVEEDLSTAELSVVLLGLRDPSPHANIEETANQRGRKIAVHGMLNVLNRFERQIIQMRYFDELEPRQVARSLGVRTELVCRTELKAKKKLLNSEQGKKLRAAA